MGRMRQDGLTLILGLTKFKGKNLKKMARQTAIAIT